VSTVQFLSATLILVTLGVVFGPYHNSVLARDIPDLRRRKVFCLALGAAMYALILVLVLVLPPTN
jgi:hypothetical protein